RLAAHISTDDADDLTCLVLDRDVGESPKIFHGHRLQRGYWGPQNTPEFLSKHVAQGDVPLRSLMPDAVFLAEMAHSHREVGHGAASTQNREGTNSSTSIQLVSRKHLLHKMLYAVIPGPRALGSALRAVRAQASRAPRNDAEGTWCRSAINAMDAFALPPTDPACSPAISSWAPVSRLS